MMAAKFQGRFSRQGQGLEDFYSLFFQAYVQKGWKMFGFIQKVLKVLTTPKIIIR